jgi:phage head maturation protease
MTDLTVKLFLPFEKKDGDQRIVEGYATTEALDSQGEIIKSEAIEKALPDYMKFANIREMHQPSAVGKTISAKMDKNKRGLEIAAKVVDPIAWEKVKEGVYNGFSIGGRIVKRVGNVIHEVILNEISLVDRPANPEAVFSLVKMADGGEVSKQEMEPDAVEEPAHLGVSLAGRLLDFASNITMYIQMCEDMKRDCKHLEKCITALKDAATKELELDKMAKAEENKQSDEKKAELVKELDKAKAMLEGIVNSKPIQEDWSNKYFEQHDKVV